MIFFKDLPTQEQAVENLTEQLLRQQGGRGYTKEEMTELVERGCSLALATMRSMDDKLREAVTGLGDADSMVVQSVALTQINLITKVSIEALMLESFFKMMGLKP